jgi:YHS domain-containing protein
LAEGERVVAAGTFLVDSESRLKSTAQASGGQPREKVAPRSKNQSGLAASTDKAKDPACGMMIDAATAVAEGNTVTRDGVTYYFCSDSCKKKFGAQPEHFVALNPSGPDHD